MSRSTARIGRLLAAVAMTSCGAPAEDDRATLGPTATLDDGADDGADDDDGDDGDDGADDDGSTGTSGGDGGGSMTAFDTLTTYATTEPDPTNTSEDTNDTGTTAVDILPENLIDDLEDGDAVIYELGGRIGVWYAYDDATAGTQNPAAGDGFLPTPGGPNESSFSAMMVGGGFTNWGAGMGFDINNSGGATKRTFDASAFEGIAFQARGDVPIRFKVQTEAIVPTTEGGTCTAGDACNDAYFVDIELTPTWQQHVVPFAMLHQGNWGQAAAWDPATVMGLQFEVAAGTSFEVAVDDVGFY